MHLQNGLFGVVGTLDHGLIVHSPQNLARMLIESHQSAIQGGGDERTFRRPQSRLEIQRIQIDIR